MVFKKPKISALAVLMSWLMSQHCCCDDITFGVATLNFAYLFKCRNFGCQCRDISMMLPLMSWLMSWLMLSPLTLRHCCCDLDFTVATLNFSYLCNVATLVVNVATLL